MITISVLLQKIGRRLQNYYRTAIAFFQIVILYSKKEKDEVLVIMPQYIGDVCYAMAYMQAFTEEKKEDGLLVRLLINESRKDFLKMYPCQNDVTWMKNKSPELNRQQWILQRRACVKVAKRFGIYSTVPYYYIKPNGRVDRDGLNILRNSLLDIKGCPKIDYPNVPSVPINSIHDFENYKDKIVVINPYSNSVHDFDFDIFEEIAEILREKGYFVYTNVVGEQKPIKGTSPLDCSINELYNICQHIPLFISVRSGIVDFCISSRTKFFVIHFNNAKKVLHDFYQVYILSAWGTGNATEVLYDNNPHVIKEFIKFTEIYKI